MSADLRADLDAIRTRACNIVYFSSVPVPHEEVRQVGRDVLLLLEDIAVLKALLKHEEGLVRQLDARIRGSQWENKNESDLSRMGGGS